ncbi:MAG: glycosyltransferase family 2 protein [Rhodothermales bacterium]|nr:glycosyltransferase family 2 protein [Rhodothermales bacterium]
MSEPKTYISIVIPLHDEEDSVAPLCRAVTAAMESADVRFETILVDDGSRDQTFARASDVASQDTRFRVVKLNRNFGQTAALKAGFEIAAGDIIVTMDGDLQNDPEDIPMMLQKISEGFDMVVGWRKNRQDSWALRKIPSRIANWLVRKSTGTTITDNGCALRAYRSEVIKRYPLYSEMHRLLPTILAMTGARMAELPVRHHPRQYGRSKYGLARTYKVILDLVALRMILTFHRSPLFGFGISGTVLGLLSMGVLITGFLQLLTNQGDVSLIYPGIGILLGSLSVSLLTMGILCDMIYVTGDTKMRPFRNSPLDA